MCERRPMARKTNQAQWREFQTNQAHGEKSKIVMWREIQLRRVARYVITSWQEISKHLPVIYSKDFQSSTGRNHQGHWIKPSRKGLTYNESILVRLDPGACAALPNACSAQPGACTAPPIKVSSKGLSAIGFFYLKWPLPWRQMTRTRTCQKKTKIKYGCLRMWNEFNVVCLHIISFSSRHGVLLSM